jgi:hypothetical protein
LSFRDHDCQRWSDLLLRGGAFGSGTDLTRWVATSRSCGRLAGGRRVAWSPVDGAQCALGR